MTLLYFWTLLAFADPPNVVGGTLAAEDAWPDAAAIYNSNNPYCSGVLIAPDLVLSAGHCQNNAAQVRLDVLDLTSEDGVSREITNLWVYPDYLTTLDVLLLQLDEPVDISPRLLALDCLADNYVVNGQPVYIVGYGATDLNGLNFSDRLMEAETTITDSTCSTPGKDCNPDVIPYGELIAGGDGIDSCVRDSGGPLYARTAHGDYLAGLTSRGIKPADTTCGDGGIYVRADALADWVEESAGVTLERPDCSALGLNQRPDPQSGALIALDGVGTVQIDPGDPDTVDTHTFEIIAEPTWGEATVDELGWVTYSGPLDETLEDQLSVRVTDSGSPPLSSDLVVYVQLEPAPFEDPGGCACLSIGAAPLFSGVWVGIPLLLWHHRRRKRSHQ